MAQYRRKLSPSQQKHFHSMYKLHKDLEGGIFTPDKRRKLLGLKSKSRKIAPENLANFWSDVRKHSKNGIVDLHLLADMIHPDQVKEVFQLIPWQEWNKDNSKTSLAGLVKAVLESEDESSRDIRKRRSKQKYANDEEPDVWKAFLAQHIVDECLDFFIAHGFVTSKAHQRIVDELKDMLNVEIGHKQFQERGLRNVMI